MNKILSFVAAILFCLQSGARAHVLPQTTSEALQTGDGIHFLYVVNSGGLGGPPFFPGQVGAAALNTNRTHAQAWETFKLIHLTQEKVELQTSGGDWVTAVDNGGVTGPNFSNSSPIHSDAISEMGAPTTFIVTPVDSVGHVTLQTCDGHFLTANNGGGFSGPDRGPGVVPIHTAKQISRAAGAWEIFSMLPAPTCAFNQIEIKGQTGFDNADPNLAILININGLAGEICLKTSNDPSLVKATFPGISPNSPWAGCPVGSLPDSSFAVGSSFDTGKITLLNPLPITAFSTMTIGTMQGICSTFCSDWALQSVTVIVSNSFNLVKPQVLLNIPSNGSNGTLSCIAYFDAYPNATKVTFSLTGSEPPARWVDGIQSGQRTSCNPP